MRLDLFWCGVDACTSLPFQDRLELSGHRELPSPTPRCWLRLALSLQTRAAASSSRIGPSKSTLPPSLCTSSSPGRLTAPLLYRRKTVMKTILARGRYWTFGLLGAMRS